MLPHQGRRAGAVYLKRWTLLDHDSCDLTTLAVVPATKLINNNFVVDEL